jgi:hypothetical protein
VQCLTAQRNDCRQVIANCSFEHEEGRLAGIGVCKSLSESLPEPVLNEHAMAFILTLALRLVNDSSSRCRRLIAEVRLDFSLIAWCFFIATFNGRL